MARELCQRAGSKAYIAGSIASLGSQYVLGLKVVNCKSGDTPRRDHQSALEFVAGYAIEASLSVDNLFVFLILFQGFRISPRRQHTALLWGVAGAVVLRALFIAAGITLLHRFAWITWIFAVILLYAAWRLLRGGSANAAIPAWIRKLQPAKGSLLPVILAVELTDLLFAVD